MPEENNPINTVHAFEQGEAALLDLAKLLGSYMNQLLIEGFLREEAFELVSKYQDVIYRGAGNGNQNP